MSEQPRKIINGFDEEGRKTLTVEVGMHAVGRFARTVGPDGTLYQGEVDAGGFCVMTECDLPN